MTVPKTRPTNIDPKAYLNTDAPERHRADAIKLLDIIGKLSGEPAIMWGPSIIGFGSYLPPQKNASTWPIIAFSPRKNDLTIYLMAGTQACSDLLDRLGPHKVGSSCLYLKSLDKIDMSILRDLMRWSIDTMREKYPQ
jgi:hypothetical protein